MHRLISFALFAAALLSAAAPIDPWTPDRTMEPAALAAEIRSNAAPVILMVGPQVLFSGAHIRGAIYAGLASSPEGLRLLVTAARRYKPDRAIVIYCGCCPIARCPNVRPAFQALRDAGFTNVKLLQLPTGAHADWTAPGYPVDADSSN